MRKLICLFVGLSLPLSTALSQSPDAPIVRYDDLVHPVLGPVGMVASQNELASEVGAQILADGGNAVDAAVAVGFALAVTLPRAGNLGGGGFMLVHDAESGESIAIDSVGEQGFEVGRLGGGGEPLEEVSEVRPGLDPVGLRGLHQAVEVRARTGAADRVLCEKSADPKRERHRRSRGGHGRGLRSTSGVRTGVRCGR